MDWMIHVLWCLVAISGYLLGRAQGENDAVELWIEYE